VPAPLLDEMLAFAAELRQHAADCLRAGDRARYEKYSRRADAIEKAASDLLPLPPDHATLATMDQAQTREQRVSRARLDKANRRHPFVAALVAKGLTVTVLAKELGYSRSTVQSWYDADEANGRPIPRAAAVAIQKRLGVPLSAWRRIVD
jgi:lambda repressor-like predicted transcriptional regulator